VIGLSVREGLAAEIVLELEIFEESFSRLANDGTAMSRHVLNLPLHGFLDLGRSGQVMNGTQKGLVIHGLGSDTLVRSRDAEASSRHSLFLLTHDRCGRFNRPTSLSAPGLPPRERFGWLSRLAEDPDIQSKSGSLVASPCEIVESILSDFDGKGNTAQSEIRARSERRSIMIWPFRRRNNAQKPAPLDAAAIVRRARRLRFRVRPDAVSQLAGAYHGARPGIGLTFAELRAYEPGDDVRHLDWNVTARQGRPFVRRFVEERALCLWLVVDVSASMRFGPERKTKADRAAQAAALLATAAIQNGDRAGLILVSDRIEVELPPAGGVRHLSQLVRALVATPTTSPKTRLSVGLARVRRTARRAMIVVISDFITEEPITTWRRAARRHDTIALRVVDPREDQLPDAGLLVLEDAEKGATRAIDTSSRRVRKRYAETAARHSAAFQRWCTNSGIQAFTMTTDADPIVPLIELFSRRAARRGPS
jgi:uncharacterized protein (DUF58 family)